MFAQCVTDGLLTQVLVVDYEDRALIGGPGVRRVLERIASVAESRACLALLGASPSGERLIGAVLASFPGMFHVWDPGREEPVLVVEGIALGDSAVRRAMDVADRCGAAQAFGVLISPAEGSSWLSSPSVHAVSSSPARDPMNEVQPRYELE